LQVQENDAVDYFQKSDILVLAKEGAKIMSVKRKKKKEIIDKFKEHPEDTGSAKVQVAILTERINNLTDHFKSHAKDFHSRRGLLMLVGKRRRLLKYIKDNDPQKYQKVLKELKLRK